MIQSIIVFTVVAYIAFPEEHHPKISNGMRIALLIATFIWFSAVMARVDEDFDNQCTKLILVIYSIASTIISAGIVYVGFPAVNLIQ